MAGTAITVVCRSGNITRWKVSSSNWHEGNVESGGGAFQPTIVQYRSHSAARRMEIVGSSSCEHGETFLGDGLEGYSISPKRDCEHVGDEGFQIDEVLQEGRCKTGGKEVRGTEWGELIRCKTCGDAEETWVCLRCGARECGRYREGHMLKHWQDKNGCKSVIAISTVDLSVWCFDCDEYITNPKLNKVYSRLHRLKFGDSPAGNLHWKRSAMDTWVEIEHVERGLVFTLKRGFAGRGGGWVEQGIRNSALFFFWSLSRWTKRLLRFWGVRSLFDFAFRTKRRAVVFCKQWRHWKQAVIWSAKYERFVGRVFFCFCNDQMT